MQPTRLRLRLGERLTLTLCGLLQFNGGSGLSPTVAQGLAAFLNSTLVDAYFRQFSGHTQVNATDLRSLRYPGWGSLLALGRRIGKSFPDQEELDRLVEEIVFRG